MEKGYLNQSHVNLGDLFLSILSPMLHITSLMMEESEYETSTSLSYDLKGLTLQVTTHVSSRYNRPKISLLWCIILQYVSSQM